MQAADAVEGGLLSAGDIEALAAAGLGDLEVDYVTLASSSSARSISRLETDSVLAVAAKVGATRLIDNVSFCVTPNGVQAERGRRLDRQSLLYSRSL